MHIYVYVCIIYIYIYIYIYRASMVVQMVKNLPATQETWVRSLVGEDPLEKGLATHSSILAWRIPWREDPGRLQSQRVRYETLSNLPEDTQIV